ncbi:MAG TPA: DnaJ domain-containing protein [Anaerolineales bacterium]|nr:DnaJ domain-containing protein [Anaerolineales bacterium]HNO92569.1 DnaJ domain-containing protein [Anaerolineales bacterium]
MYNENSTRSYPLYWPEGWPRTERHKIKRAQFKDRSVFTARKQLELEVRRFGGRELIISSNLELKLDGMPRSGQKQPADKGVAIFFTRNKVEMALACDVYSTVEDNLWALVRTLDALRQIERDGSPALINKAFKGFAALPDPNERNWWEVLGVAANADDDQIKTAYRDLARRYHPDNAESGNIDTFHQIQKAYEQAVGRK